MASPRITIDQLPEQAAPTDDDMLMLQDSGVSKKMSIATLKGLTPVSLTNHLAAVTDAHDATAISAISTGVGVDGPNVQAQLAQLLTLINVMESTLGGEITTLTGQITTLNDQVTTLNGQVATLISDLDALEVRVTDLETP